MDRRIAETIINSLEASLLDTDNDRAIFNNYETYPITKENFHLIEPIKPKNKIVFIDGGNTEIASAANFSLQFIRIYGCVFEGRRKVSSVKHEFYALVTVNIKENAIKYKSELFTVKGDILINQEDLCLDTNDQTIKEGVSIADISKIPELARKFSEIALSKRIAEKLNAGDIIVMDGNLQSLYTNQEKYLDELYEQGKSSGVFITALSKTSRIFTEKGNSMAGLLNEIGPDESWYYYPCAKINDSKHKAELYFVKLHERSKYVFRFDVFNEQSKNIKQILGLLKENTKDIVFPGYPYGLILADKFARVSNQEREYLRTILESKAGRAWGRIRQHTNSINAHNVLDKIS